LDLHCSGSSNYSAPANKGRRPPIIQQAQSYRQTIPIQNPNRDFVWAPIGRAAWDSSVRRKILDGWNGNLQPLLLKAGFAHGDKEYLPLAIESIGRLANRIN
jgi:hypothetical protein